MLAPEVIVTVFVIEIEVTAYARSDTETSIIKDGMKNLLLARCTRFSFTTSLEVAFFIQVFRDHIIHRYSVELVDSAWNLTKSSLTVRETIYKTSMVKEGPGPRGSLLPAQTLTLTGVGVELWGGNVVSVGGIVIT